MKKFKKFVELTKQKKELKSMMKDLENELKEAENEILEEMAESGIGHINIDGATVYLSQITVANPIGGKEAVLEYVQKYVPEIVSETYNTNSFNAYVREMIEQDGLPDHFSDHFNVDTFYKAKVRIG